MDVKIIKIDDSNYTVNGKTVTEDMSGSFTNMSFLEEYEKMEFNKYITAIRADLMDTSFDISAEEITKTELHVVYMAHCGHSLIPKNKLQTALSEYLLSIDRKTVFNEDLKEFKAEILSKIKMLNSEFNRCEPLKISFWENENDFIISGFNIVRFSLKHGVIEI